MTVENNLIKNIKDNILSITDDNRVEVKSEIKRLFCEFSSNLFQSNFLFAYGSLRKGQNGYSEIKALFGPEGIEHIYTTRWDYKKIVDLGPYPALLDSKSPDYVVGDVIYVSDEAFDYIKSNVELDGFITDSATLWVPKGSPDSHTVKMLSIPCYIAGDKLIESIEKDKVKYPKIEVCDWIRYQKQTKADTSEEEEERSKQMQLMWNEHQCWD